MKKKISLLIVIILSLFVFSSRVEAAKELTCVYDDSGWRDFMFFQDADGNIQFYYLSYYEGVPSSSSGEWQSFSYDEIKYDTDKYNGEYLTGCPDAISFSQCQGFLCLGGTKDIFTFKDDGSTSLVENKEGSNDSSHIPIDTDVFTYNNNNDYWKIVNSNDWTAECTYYDSTNDNTIYFYFNDERYILINEAESTYANTLKFTLDEVNTYFEEVLYNCPPRLYSTISNPNANGHYERYYYLKKPNVITNVFEFTNIQNKVNVFQPEPDDSDIVIKNCKDLFGDDLVNKINDVMDIIKIVIPILLIVLGIVDFTKAIFSGSEEDMSKSQKTFLKRIVAAILVFFVPVFINLILSIANEVWTNISPDACIEQTK